MKKVPNKTYSRMLSKLTPAKSIHSKYQKDVSAFISIYNRHFGNAPDADRFTFRKSVRSELFGRDYAVAYAPTNWFREALPGCDAGATSQLRIGSLTSPPIVVVPKERERTTTVAFRSVLEHEFVHINQMLLGLFPLMDSKKENPFHILLEVTRTEYEANFIQLSRWPKLYALPAGHGISLENWCILRGYTQALELIVKDILKAKLSRAKIEKFLTDSPKKLPSGFQKIGLERAQGEVLAGKFLDHLTIAITLTLKQGFQPSSPAESNALRVLDSWIKESRANAEFGL